MKAEKNAVAKLATAYATDPEKGIGELIGVFRTPKCEVYGLHLVTRIHQGYKVPLFTETFLSFVDLYRLG